MKKPILDFIIGLLIAAMLWVMNQRISNLETWVDACTCIEARR